MFDILSLLALVLFGSVFALIGGLVLLLVPKWAHTLSCYSVSFAGGVLLTVSLLGLLPEAVEHLDHEAYYVVFATFLLVFLFENVFFTLHHHDEDGHHHIAKRSAWFVMLGDTIHNTIDGVAIAASYLINPSLGLVTAISTFLHEVPHEMGDFGILLKAGWKKKSIILTNLFSALVSVVAALIVFWHEPSEQFLGILLSISAGLFLYLGASDFLPHAGANISKKNMVIALLAGVGLMLISLFAIPHAH